ncbi:hypothetical protein D3C73_1376210 [compost metagenome]
MTTKMDVTPEVINGKLYLPLRYLVEAIDGKVSWDANDRAATTITVGNNTATYWINNNMMEFNGTSKDTGGIVHLYGERTVVPAEFLAELLGWELDWNTKTGSITLSK